MRATPRVECGRRPDGVISDAAVDAGKIRGEDVVRSGGAPEPAE
jgi:hypothetical protein